MLTAGLLNTRCSLLVPYAEYRTIFNLIDPDSAASAQGHQHIPVSAPEVMKALGPDSVLKRYLDLISPFYCTVVKDNIADRMYWIWIVVDTEPVIAADQIGGGVITVITEKSAHPHDPPGEVPGVRL